MTETPEQEMIWAAEGIRMRLVETFHNLSVALAHAERMAALLEAHP